jgi:hypothetical protein
MSRVPGNHRSKTMTPEQQMLALAGAMPQQGVAVGACGPMAYNPAAGGNGYPGLAALGQGGLAAGTQGCNPAPPVSNLVQDCATYQECFVPLGLSFGVDLNGNVYPSSQIGAPVSSAVGAAPFFQLFPKFGWFFIFGVKFFNGPGEVQIDVVQSGDIEINHVLSSTDAATWNTTECFCPCNWGCVSVTNSLKIQAHAVNAAGTTVVGVRGACWGIRRSSLYACGPQYQCGPGGYGGNGSAMPVPGNGG